jgi:hypothetical protein
VRDTPDAAHYMEFCWGIADETCERQSKNHGSSLTKP